MTEIVTDSMAGLDRWHRAILKFSPEWDPRFARAMYEGFLRLGTRASIALEGNRVVGTSLYFPATEEPWAVEHAQHIPEPLSNCIVRTHIYVADDARGSGLSRALTAASSTDAIAQGYTHALAYGYQTEEIYEWARKIHEGLPSQRYLPVTDRSGRRTWITALADLVEPSGAE